MRRNSKESNLYSRKTGNSIDHSEDSTLKAKKEIVMELIAQADRDRTTIHPVRAIEDLLAVAQMIAQVVATQTTADHALAADSPTIARDSAATSEGDNFK